MRKILILGFAAILAVLTLGLSTGSANAAATDTTKIWSGLGSGHLYEGSYDACTGAIAPPVRPPEQPAPTPRP